MRKKTTFERFCLYIAEHRIGVLSAVLLLTAVFGIGMFRIRTEVVLSEMFPYDHPYLKIMEKFGRVFGGGGSGVVVAVKVNKGDIFNENTLTKIKEMTGEVELWEEVYRVLTVSMASNSAKVIKTKGKRGDRDRGPYVPQHPQDAGGDGASEEEHLLQPRLQREPGLRDGTACLLVTEFKENISYSTAFTRLRGLVAKYSDADTSVHIVGFPMLMGWIYSLTPQMYMVFRISILAIALGPLARLRESPRDDLAACQRGHPDRLGSGVHRFHRDQLQPTALRARVSRRGPDDRQLPPDRLPVLRRARRQQGRHQEGVLRDDAYHVGAELRGGGRRRGGLWGALHCEDRPDGAPRDHHELLDGDDPAYGPAGAASLQPGPAEGRARRGPRRAASSTGRRGS